MQERQERGQQLRLAWPGNVGVHLFLSGILMITIYHKLDSFSFLFLLGWLSSKGCVSALEVGCVRARLDECTSGVHSP